MLAGLDLPPADPTRVAPADCPFAPSDAVRGLRFTGRHAHYTSADTWYPSWASDGALYSPWTDGCFGESWTMPVDCSSAAQWCNEGRGGLTGTGQARITGEDPLHLTLENLGVDYASPAPYGGRYPCGSLVHDGVWYYGTYALDETGRLSRDGKRLNWDVLGPFVGFRVSHDLGRSWEPCPHTPEAPIFGESGKGGRKVRFGAPHFVDFGRNMEHSPDGRAYLVGHGTTDPASEAAWIRGDGAWMARVRPSPETMNDPSAWEFFAGHDASGKPLWTPDLGRSRPLVHWPGRLGHVTITFVPALGRYLLCGTDGGDTVSRMNSFVLESDRLTGPWRLVTWWEGFGEQAYFLNFPSKFLSSEGRRAWLCYSANFTNLTSHGTDWRENPPGSRYAMSLQEVEIL